MRCRNDVHGQTSTVPPQQAYGLSLHVAHVPLSPGYAKQPAMPPASIVIIPPSVEHTAPGDVVRPLQG